MSAATMNEMERLRRERDEAFAKGKQAFDDLRRVEAERDALVNRVDFLNQQNSAQQEQNDELAAYVEKLTACANAVYAANNVENVAGFDRLIEAVDEAATTSLARRYAEELMNGATPCPDGGKCHKSGLTCGDPICEEWGADLKAEWQAEAYLAGWKASGEGWNDEYPGDAHENDLWINERDEWLRQQAKEES